MLRLVESPAAPIRLKAARDFVAELDPDQEILVVGPTRDAVDDFVRDVTASRTATFGLHRFTLLQLASRITAEGTAAAGLAPATSLATEALAARCINEAGSERVLSYFAPVSSFPGFARALARTCMELRMAQVPADAVRDLGGAGLDLADLLDRFTSALTAAGLMDRAALLALAAGIARGGESTLRLDLPILLLDVEVAAPVEVDLLRALLDQAPTVLATVPAGDQRTAAALARCGAVPLATAPGPDAGPKSLARIREHLFSYQDVGEAVLDESMRFFSAPGEGREAVEIARAVLDEARCGVRLDDMAVFLRMPETYVAALQAAFARAGVPAYFARGTKRPDPSGRAFMTLLACAAEGLSAKRFAAYLAFGETPRQEPAEPTWSGSTDEMMGAAVRAASESEQTAQPAAADGQPWQGAAPWRWEELIVEASVIGSRARWERRLNGLHNELRLKHGEAESEDPDSPLTRRLQRQIHELEHLREFALPVIARLAELPKAAAWGEWLTALSALAPLTLRRPERVLRVLAELSPMAQVGPVGIDEVMNVVADRLAFLEEDPPATRFGRVFIGAAEHARARSFAVVFVPGLAERIFPQRPREDPLLLDAPRTALSPDLLTTADRGQGERLILRAAVGAARERVYFSYPRVDVVEARARVPSFYGLDVMRAASGHIPNIDAFEQSAARLADARLAWPAPHDATRAIDPIEHDLSTLHRLFHDTSDEERKGRARYLFNLNDNLARSLRARFARWERPQWSEHDGIVRVTPATADALAARRMAATPYSPSALERYAVCPYRFFLSAIHRLEPRREITTAEQMDPLTRGRLMHEVQAETLRTLRDQNLLPLQGEALASAEGVLVERLSAIAERYRDALAPPILRVWQDEVDGLRIDLVAWLRHIAADAAWQPRFFELGFGLRRDPGRDAASLADPVAVAGGARLRGSIDLVEYATTGGDVRVTDHKTGSDRTRTGMIVGNGETLQPVLYAFAVEAALQATVRESRLFFCTNRGGFAERVVPIDDSARTAGRRVLEVIDRAIENGVLAPAPRADACTHCDFRLVCGPHESDRAGRKDRRLLRDLEALRSMP